MVYKVVGAEHKEGSMTDKETGELIQWNNICLQLVSTRSPLKVSGSAVRVGKLAVADSADILKPFGGDYKQLVGHEADIGFSNAKTESKVTEFEVVK